MLAKKVHQLIKNKEKPNYLKGLPSLQDLALDVVAEHFEKYPHLTGLKESIKLQIIAKAKPSVPIETAAIYIDDENYWKRACSFTYGKELPNNDHGTSYKQAFLERHLQEKLENRKAEDEKEKLVQMLKALKDNIFNLNLSQLPSHLDVSILFKILKNLTNFTVTYGAKHLGVKYQRVAFGMTIEDANNLEECIKMTRSLVSLGLPGNMIDKDIISRLIRGLVLNSSITQLDLSHNSLADAGGRRIAKYIVHTKILTHLNLCDNNIHYEGSRYIAKAMKTNTSIVYLNLMHNRISDTGGAKMCQDLIENPTLKELNLAANSLGKEVRKEKEEFLQFCAQMCGFIVKNTAITQYDISCNFIEDVDAESLLSAISACKHITLFDVRSNKIGKKLVNEIMSVANKNYADKLQIPFIKTEIVMQEVTAKKEESEKVEKEKEKEEKKTEKSEIKKEQSKEEKKEKQ